MTYIQTIRTLLPFTLTGAAMPPQTAGIGSEERFGLHDEIGLQFHCDKH
jgi:hypothetical protein